MSVKQNLCLADVYVGHTQETMIGVICLVGLAILALIIAGLCMTGMASRRIHEADRQELRSRGALFTYLGTLLAVWGIAALELSFYDEYGIAALVPATLALIAWLVKKKKASHILLSIAVALVMAQPIVVASGHGTNTVEILLAIYIAGAIVLAIVTSLIRRAGQIRENEYKKPVDSPTGRTAHAVLYVYLIGLMISAGAMMVALHSLWYLISQIPPAIFLVFSLINWFDDNRRKAVILAVIGALLAWWCGALTVALEDWYLTFIYKGRRW